MNETSYTAYIGLGSNIEPQHNALRALQLIAQRFTVEKWSPFYFNTAIGPVSGGNMFINGIVRIKTSLNQQSLKKELLDIEAQFGRGCERFQPRQADLDIIVHYACKKSEQVHLHPDLLKRDFVFKPLLDIEPDFIHPQLHIPLNELLRNIAARPMKAVHFSKEEISLPTLG